MIPHNKKGLSRGLQQQAVTLGRTARVNPKLGVSPPSAKAQHSSMRCAPPNSVATADSTESTQISRCIMPAPWLARSCYSVPGTAFPVSKKGRTPLLKIIAQLRNPGGR
jgi:hypothetical protein